VFNIGPGELALILVAALIVLGPKRLPELARQLGKFMRDFRRQTDDVRNMVEREFYKMDQQLEQQEKVGAGAQPPAAAPALPLVPPPPAPVPAMTDPGHDEYGRLIAPPLPANPPPAEAPAKPPNGEAPADLKNGGQ
jgi:sec-independent protein translocase protein TatB